MSDSSEKKISVKNKKRVGSMTDVEKQVSRQEVEAEKQVSRQAVEAEKQVSRQAIEADGSRTLFRRNGNGRVNDVGQSSRSGEKRKKKTIRNVHHKNE